MYVLAQDASGERSKRPSAAQHGARLSGLGGATTARSIASITRFIWSAANRTIAEVSPTAAIIDSQSVKSAEKGGPVSIRMA